MYEYVQILERFDTEGEALKKELELIQEYKKEGHPITNILGVDENASINIYSEEKIGYPEEIHDFCKKFYQISHKKQEGVRISIVTTKM